MLRRTVVCGEVSAGFTVRAIGGGQVKKEDEDLLDAIFTDITR